MHVVCRFRVLNCGKNEFGFSKPEREQNLPVFIRRIKSAGADLDDIPKNFNPAEEAFLPWYDSNGDFDGFEDYCSDDFGSERIDFDDD